MNTASNSNGDAMIEAKGLSKFYGPFIATKNISFSIPRGQVAAFLGPNGAGKSTTMKLLTGYLAPTEGSAHICGLDMEQDRLTACKNLGYLPENGPLYNEMTPGSFLKYVGNARGMGPQLLSERLEYVRKQCALESVWGKAIDKLSRGYRQRVGMAQALLHDPDVLILDEPTSGLDPNQLHDARELIKKLGETKTILLSTHILQEVRAVCSRVLLVNEGSLVFDGPLDDLGTNENELEKQFLELTRPKAAQTA